MENIIELLKEKNHFLEKFSKLNETELVKFDEGDFDSLEKFYSSRERLLAIVGQLDFMIEQQSSVEFYEDISKDKKSEVVRVFDHKNALVTKIVSQDLQILSCIDNEKSQIIKDLSNLKTSKKVLGSYKSGGKTNSLDEKA